ncbi:hypothetical protein [Algibacillus agarilyticus]|uniref:hypothetical protein n=1 Tax=Algibacillus agarilyticus TaxID=2234133 RepID=UPI000DD0BF3C|nr:hypothetical protein [Algibacillus agarilyticus]
MDLKRFLDDLLACDAQVVIPLNDESRRFLLHVSQHVLAQADHIKAPLARLLAHSVYSAASSALLDKRLTLSDTCQTLALDTPAFTGDLSPNSIQHFYQQHSAPFVVKLDGTDAGNGVTYYASAAEYPDATPNQPGIAQ